MSSHDPRPGYGAFVKGAPSAFEGLSTLSQAAVAGGLDKGLIELVKIRASQINGCAFCLQYHINLARKLGVPQAKLDLVAVWREAPLFADDERAALAFAEEATHLSAGGVGDDAYRDAVAAFGAEGVVSLTIALAAINAWNRIGVALRFAPPPAA